MALAVAAAATALGLELFLPVPPRPEAPAAVAAADEAGSPLDPSAAPGAGRSEFRAAREAAFQRLALGDAASAAFPAAAPPAEADADSTSLLPELRAPRTLRAGIQEGGIRLSWQPSTDNPVEGLRYSITRWAGAGEAEEVAVVDGLEHLDRVECEGLTYYYRVRALLEREVRGGRLARRESPSVAASAELPRRAVWTLARQRPDGSLDLFLERPGRPTLGPLRAVAGLEIGSTGWYLEAATVGPTSVRAETRIPRFDALGRRVIIDGRPADRIRVGTVKRLLATLRLSDPCGTSWNLELLLPEGSETTAGD
ncbi:MAG TPA: hypothetical protein VGC54_12445 [Planctomycetota bacterium]